MEFAKLEDNIVTDIIVVSEQDSLNESGIYEEQVGASFCNNLFEGTWIQSGYAQSTRKNHAIIGVRYDPINDGYIYEQPFPSWTLNEVSCSWESPVDYPVTTGGEELSWDEDTTSWVGVVEPA